MIDRLINVLVMVTLIEMMAATGLGVTLGDLAGVARNWRLLARAALANYVCVPAVTVSLLILFDAQPLIAVGFLILAACPGAPFGPPLTAIAKGDVPAAVGLMVVLAGSSALIAPLLLCYLLQILPGSEPLEVHAMKIVGTLLLTQLLPLYAGVSVRQWQPALADRLRQPAALLSKVLNLGTVGSILIAKFHLVLDTPARGFAGMFALLIASWAAGWWLGGPGFGQRKAMTLTTSLRNVGVGLVIATGSFAGTPAVTATLVFGLFEIVGSLLLALAWAQHARTRQARATAPMPETSASAFAATEPAEIPARGSIGTGAATPGARHGHNQ
jgi:bile acid:Na+ symporter, BASS family